MEFGQADKVVALKYLLHYLERIEITETRCISHKMFALSVTLSLSPNSHVRVCQRRRMSEQSVIIMEFVI